MTTEYRGQGGQYMANITVETRTALHPSSGYDKASWDVNIHAFIAEDPEEVFETALKRVKAALSAIDQETIDALIAEKQHTDALRQEFENSFVSERSAEQLLASRL